MTILYEGFRGNGPSTVLIVCFSIFGLLGLVSLILSIKERDSGCTLLSFVGIILAITVIVLNLTSHRYPIVRATINDTTSFKEVYESYELIDVEGDIYTFRVKDSNE